MPAETFMPTASSNVLSCHIPESPFFKRKSSCLQLHRTFSHNPFSSGNPHAYSFIERFVISILRSRKLFASFQAEPGERDDMAKSHPPPHPPTPHPIPTPENKPKCGTQCYQTRIARLVLRSPFYAVLRKPRHTMPLLRTPANSGISSTFRSMQDKSRPQ